MHFKRRRRRAGRVVLFVLATVLLAALGTGMWLLWPRAMRRDMPSAAAPQGTLRGLRLSWSYPTAAGGLSSGGPEVLDTLFADAAAYAQAHGLNVLFLDVADAELSSIAFRDRAYETWPGAAADDSLFHKYDPLRALCEQASQAGLAVYAVTPELSGNADWEAALARMQKKYAVAGLYVEGSALFDSISRQAVFYADEAAFNDPSSLFLASLDTDGFHGAVFDYARCRAQPEAFSVLASALDGSAARPALLEYTPGGTLAVSYPADGAAVYTSACFVMGTSDPAQELLLNGTPVESRGPGGTFGVLVDVAEGSNVYTLTQGGTSVSVTVNRPAPAGGGSGGQRRSPTTTLQKWSRARLCASETGSPACCMTPRPTETSARPYARAQLPRWPPAPKRCAAASAPGPISLPAGILCWLTMQSRCRRKHPAPHLQARPPRRRIRARCSPLRAAAHRWPIPTWWTARW